MALKGAGQLYGKKVFVKVSRKGKQFQKGAEKQAAGDVHGGLFYKLCMYETQLHAGKQDVASRVVRQLQASEWRKRCGKLL